MTHFSTIPEAFDWWVRNIYPTLPPDTKKGKAVQAMQDYIYERGISETRMKDILIRYGEFEIQTIIVHKPQ